MESAENNASKSEGQILFKIEKLSEFARAPVETERLSEVVFVRGLPWRILAVNRRNNVQRRLLTPGQLKCLGYFLQCNVDNPGEQIKYQYKQV